MLISTGENHAALGTPAAFDAFPFLGWGVPWDVPNRRLRFLFDFLLTFAGTAPVAPEESAIPIKDFVEVRVVVNSITMFFAELSRTFEHRGLNRVEHLAHGLPEA